MEHSAGDRVKTALLAVAVAGLLGGLLLTYVIDRPDLAETTWMIGVVPVLAALLIEIMRSLARGEVGLDIVAALSMTAPLVFGETLAAAIVAVMYSGGTFLESFAEGRARREMSDLLSRVPRTATRPPGWPPRRRAARSDLARRQTPDPAGRCPFGGGHHSLPLRVYRHVGADG